MTGRMVPTICYPASAQAFVGRMQLIGLHALACAVGGKRRESEHVLHEMREVWRKYERRR